MNRFKLFIENFLAYGFINIINRIIPLFLLPVITRMLANPSDYGIYDMFTTIIGFGSPLAMLGIYDAMFREYFEKDDQQYRYNVTTTAYRIVFMTSNITGFILLIFHKSFSNILYGTSIYGNIIIFSALELILSTIKGIISAPTRIQNKRKIYVISGLMNSFIYYVIAIVLIYIGFSFYGIILGTIVSSIVSIVFFSQLNYKFFKLGSFDKYIAKELLKVGIPLVPTILIYWVYNSMDKIMIVNMLGTEQLGIYSIGAKVASVSLFIYYSFAGGWQHFAFSTMKEKDQVQLNSKIFEYLALLSYISLIMICPFIKAVFGLLFEKKYLQGYIVVPYLYLSPLLLMLFQTVENQFLIIKKSYMSTLTLSVGAVINVILNALLIPRFGVEGAAVATLTGYAVSVIMVVILTIKIKLFIVSKKTILLSIVIILYMIIFRLFIFENLFLQLFGTIAVLNIFGITYKKEITLIFKKMIHHKWISKVGEVK